MLTVPAHFDVAYVCVQIEQRPHAYGQSHDLVELRPLGRVQVEHIENELPQLRAVPVRNRRKRSAHDLQHQGRQILGEKSSVTKCIINV